MSFSLTLPLLERNATTKDYVISILSYEWPLTAKKLHSAMKKKFGKNVTYQAVYKAVKEMQSSKVLRQQADGYEISEDWVRKLHRFTEIVESNYFAKERITAIAGLKESRKEGNISILTFETYFDTEKYLHYLLKHSMSKNKAVCMHNLHLWPPLFYLRAEYNKALSAERQGISICRLCSGNTLVDKWAADFYRKLGYKVKIGVNCADVCELIVAGDTVIQVYLPTEIRQALEKAFEKVKTLSDLNMKKLIADIFEKKAAIEIVISKNDKIAKQIMDKTLSFFK
ncbi:MAG: hypothetical protein ABIB71_05230 [Candidatus Woesearchaeota archaeon]